MLHACIQREPKYICPHPLHPFDATIEAKPVSPLSYASPSLAIGLYMRAHRFRASWQPHLEQKRSTYNWILDAIVNHNYGNL